MDPMTKSFHEIERLLLPRLRFIGMVLLFFSVFCISYSILSSPYLSTLGLDKEEELVIQEQSLIPDGNEGPLKLSPFERISLYFVASVFGVVGSGCLYMFWRKREELSLLIDPPSPPEEKK